MAAKENSSSRCSSPEFRANKILNECDSTKIDFPIALPKSLEHNFQSMELDRDISITEQIENCNDIMQLKKKLQQSEQKNLELEALVENLKISLSVATETNKHYSDFVAKLEVMYKCKRKFDSLEHQTRYMESILSCEQSRMEVAIRQISKTNMHLRWARSQFDAVLETLDTMASYWKDRVR